MILVTVENNIDFLLEIILCVLLKYPKYENFKEVYRTIISKWIGFRKYKCPEQNAVSRFYIVASVVLQLNFGWSVPPTKSLQTSHSWENRPFLLLNCKRSILSLALMEQILWNVVTNTLKSILTLLCTKGHIQ